MPQNSINNRYMHPFFLFSYVKVYLLPDKSKAGKRKTRVKKHTMNPIFDEVLKYSLPLEELNSRTLWLSVWHSDMFGRNNFLGEVQLPLENKIFDDPLPKLYPLQERVRIILLKYTININTGVYNSCEFVCYR